MRPHSLRWFLSLVHNASPFFFVSLRSVRFGEGEATSVQRYGGRRRHTRYAFALGVRSGVPQVVQIKLIRNLRTDQLDPQIRLTNQVDPQVSI